MRVGLIGCGTIGTRIAEAIDQRQVNASLVGINDLERQKADALIDKLGLHGIRPLALEEIFACSDLVIEAASGKVVPEVLRLSIGYRRDCMILSVGGLLSALSLLREAEGAGIKIFCPSGAVAGLDAVSAASIGKIDRVRLTTRKPPKGLKGAPFILEKGIDLDALKGEETVFEGSALDAVSAFPKNINVAAALSLAGIGAERTEVRIIADPGSTRNSHQIEVEGEFGSLITKTENLPSPFNPKTSYLAALSAVSCLKKITGSLRIGG